MAPGAQEGPLRLSQGICEVQTFRNADISLSHSPLVSVQQSSGAEVTASLSRLMVCMLVYTGIFKFSQF